MPPRVATAGATEPLTGDDEGKRVVGPDGEVYGTVEKVDQGVAHLRSEEDDFDAIQRYLDWEDDSDEGYTFQETAVESVTDGEVVLREGGER